MLWTDFYNNFWDWADSTRRTRISSLEDVGDGSEVVDVVWEIQDLKIRSQMIRKAIKLGAKFTIEDFQNLEGDLADDVYKELGECAGFHADFPSYNKDDTSWSHFYDNLMDWPPEIQSAAIQKLSQLGPRDEIVDAILLMDGMDERVLLIQKAMSRGVKFNHDDFQNLWDMLPPEIYQAFASYTGYSAEYPDYDNDNHTWKYFCENCTDWSEELQLSAIDSLKEMGDQAQVTEAVMALTEEAPRIKLIERAVSGGIIFTKDSLVELDGVVPELLFQKLLQMAGIPEDDLYFDENNMTWDDFECCCSDWSEDLLAKRIAKLQDFADPETVFNMILSMPSSELEDALYQRALKNGVTFTENQLDAMGYGEYWPKKYMRTIADEIDLDEVSSLASSDQAAKLLLAGSNPAGSTIYGSVCIAATAADCKSVTFETSLV